MKYVIVDSDKIIGLSNNEVTTLQLPLTTDMFDLIGVNNQNDIFSIYGEKSMISEANEQFELVCLPDNQSNVDDLEMALNATPNDQIIVTSETIGSKYFKNFSLSSTCRNVRFFISFNNTDWFGTLNGELKKCNLDINNISVYGFTSDELSALEYDKFKDLIGMQKQFKLAVYIPQSSYIKNMTAYGEHIPRFEMCSNGKEYSAYFNGVALGINILNSGNYIINY